MAGWTLKLVDSVLVVPDIATEKPKFVIMKAVLLLVFVFLACVSEDPISFTEETLADVFLTENDTEITFGEVLEAHKGENIFIDVWATWCKDCIVGMPKLKML